MCRLLVQLACFWLWSSLSGTVLGVTPAPAAHGSLDLAGWNGDPLRLNGVWRFYPNELLTPDDFLRRFHQDTAAGPWIRVGQSFQEGSDGSMANLGFATYVLHLRNIPSIRAPALNGVSAYSAFRLFVFGPAGGAAAPALDVGRVATHKEAAAPAIGTTEIADFPVHPSGEAFVLIQVSNFHHRWGGLWVPPQLGRRHDLQTEYTNDLKRNYLVIGILFFTAVYSLSLYSRRREDRGSLILALLSALLVCRSLGYLGENDPLVQNPGLNFNIIFKIIYLSMLLAPTLILHFLLDYFPRQSSRRLIWGLSYALSPLLLFIAVTDVFTFSSVGLLGQYIGLSLGILCMVIAGRALVAGESGALLSNLGFSTVFIGAVMDMGTAAGVYQFPANCIGYGLVVFTMAQSQIIGVRFARAFRKAHHLGQSLQLEVNRQTREIKSIMQSIELGIFTLVDDELHIGDQYSRHLATITGKTDIHGKSIQDVLFDQARISEDSKEQMRSALCGSINSDIMNFDMNSHCLLRQMTVLSKGQAGPRIWEIDWTPITNGEDLVEKVLVCVRDVTEIRSLQEKARAQESDLSTLHELISIAEDRFSRFLNASRNLLQHSEDLLTSEQAAPHAVILRTLFMNMHTFKGMARTYQMLALSEAAHQAEQCYVQLQSRPGDWPRDRMLQDLKTVMQILNTYEKLGRENLGWTLGDRMLRIHGKDLEAVLQELRAIAPAGLDGEQRRRLLAAEHRLGRECYRTAREIILDSFKGSDSLARSLNKIPPQLTLEAGEIYLQDSAADLIHSILTHILRNSLDHGLETAAERIQVGKNPTGLMTISVRHEAPELCLSIEDDGRGLDLHSIEVIGRARGLIPQDASWSDERLAQLIFEPNFSTAKEVTEISGRGVGMQAVHNYLHEQHGRIGIQFRAQRRGGFRAFAFIVALPDTLVWIPSLLNPN